MKSKILFLWFFLFATISFAQENRNLFDFDFAQFAYDSSSNYVEFYYSLNPHAMTIKSSDSSKYIEGVLAISLEDTATKTFALNKDWKLRHELSPDTNANQNLVGVLGFAIPKGSYKCMISVKDLENNKNIKYITDYLKVKPFQSDSLGISDVQLASKIIQDSPNKNSIFYKNTYEIIPQPTLVFGESLPVVYYYCELYNHFKKIKGNSILLVSEIKNSRGKVYYKKNKPILNTDESIVEVGAIPVIKFPTDSYTLELMLLDSANSYGVQSLKRFFVYNPNIKNLDTINYSQSNVLSSIFGVMSAEECDNLLNESKYIATKTEIDQYKKLTNVSAKREFLFNFWKRRNPNPSSSKNSYLQEYLERVKVSNERYGALNLDGWKTDRGRVYIEYGEPSEVDRYPNQTDTKPYEVWHYNDIEGGVEFDFGDLTGFGDYQLLNSTKRDEMRDDNWQQRIATN